MRRALLAVALLAGALVPALPMPARAAPLSACSPTRGTVVAVDFAHFGGPLVRGCGVGPAGDPDASGLALLQDGGFTPTGTSQYGLALICRLGNAAFGGGTGYPTADPCTQTPPSSAYWSYWLAAPGATSWTYSPKGATADRPVAGGVELWMFGATTDAGTSGSGVPPAGLIPQLRATTTATPTTAADPTPTRSAGVAPTRGAPGAAPTSDPPPAVSGSGPAVTGPPATAARSTAGPAAGSTAPAVPASPRAAGSATIVAAKATPDVRHSGGSALPLLVTAAIVVALGGLGGGGTLLRRRRSGQD